MWPVDIDGQLLGVSRGRGNSNVGVVKRRMEVGPGLAPMRVEPNFATAAGCFDLNANHSMGVGFKNVTVDIKGIRIGQSGPELPRVQVEGVGPRSVAAVAGQNVDNIG